MEPELLMLPRRRRPFVGRKLQDRIVVIGISHLDGLSELMLARAFVAPPHCGIMLVDVVEPAPKDLHVLSNHDIADMAKMIKKLDLSPPPPSKNQPFYAQLFKGKRPPRDIRATRSRR